MVDMELMVLQILCGTRSISGKYRCLDLMATMIMIMMSMTVMIAHIYIVVKSKANRAREHRPNLIICSAFGEMRAHDKQNFKGSNGYDDWSSGTWACCESVRVSTVALRTI